MSKAKTLAQLAKEAKTVQTPKQLAALLSSALSSLAAAESKLAVIAEVLKQ